MNFALIQQAAEAAQEGEPALGPPEPVTVPNVEDVELWVEKGKELALAYGPALAMALAILFFGWILAKFVRGVLKRVLTRAKFDPTLTQFLCSLTYIGLMTLVVITALGRLGVPTAQFAAILAAAGLAVGLALQGSLSNFAAGVMMMIFRPIRVGEYIEAAGTAGTVEEIGIFHTTLKTPDNVKVIVANNDVTGGNIKNYSANDTRRIDLVFGIAYDDDLKKAKDILTRILTEDPRVLKEPAPVVALSELGDNSVNFVARPWVKSPDYWATRWDLTEKVKLTFDAEGITIPFPQRDVWVHNVA